MGGTNSTPANTPPSPSSANRISHALKSLGPSPSLNQFLLNYSLITGTSVTTLISDLNLNHPQELSTFISNQSSDILSPGPYLAYLVSHSITPSPIPSLSTPSSLISPSVLFLLFTQIPHNPSQLPLLFSSTLHGLSFTALSSRIVNHGSTLILIKDSNNHIFGAYSHVEITPSPSFISSPSNFIFKLYPEIQIYTNTGYNNNHQYFNHNTKTLVNGFGFGGQLNYFALFISNTMTSGHSYENTATYLNTRLSKDQEFHIKEIEVWSVKQKEVDDRLIQDKEITKDKMDMELLEMSGRKMYSKDVQEETPQQMSLHTNNRY